ncbi:cytochrome P450 [uncultured Wocania sp.]|uniref:cytochrome P450 n=1 Tax=uncultured Wocania sp. TaxID=2834404 RepID=UPI0030F69CB5
MKQLIIKLIPFKAQTLPIIYKCLSIASKIRPQKKELLFAFGGRSNYWKNMGIELFEKESVFRESILKSDAIITDLDWPSILPNFRKECPKNFFESESNVYLTIAAIQIAVLDYLKESGIIPNAIIGLSLGEITGIYAAGGISHTEVFNILKSVNLTTSREKKEYTTIYFNMNIASVLELSKRNEEIHPIYELHYNTTLACVHKDKVDLLKSKLSNIGVAFKNTNQKMFPYHTKLMGFYKEEILKCFYNLNPKPLKQDYFSTSLGKIVPKGTILGNNFWYNFQRYPVLANSTYNSIINSGKKYNIIQIGPDLFDGTKMQQTLTNNSDKPKLYSTLKKDGNSHKIFKHTYSKIKKEGQINHSAINNKGSDFDEFLKNFDLYNPSYIETPTLYWEYLKRKGNVHYIPTNSSWIVLDYDTIKYVLNDPKKFSNQPISGFDKYLAGADPPEHTDIRLLLQPLFSQKALNRIEGYILKRTNELFENFPYSEAFNFVTSFSKPLSMDVITYFLGLNIEQSKKLESIVGERIYEVGKIELKECFTEFLLKKNDFELSSAMHFIKTLYDDNKLSLDAASSLGRLLWSAGMTTTNGLLSNVFKRLLKAPYLSDQLRKSDQLINKYIDECLRIEAPEIILRRKTTQQVTIGNKTIPQESLLALDLRAGNHDETKFPNPNEIDLSRPLNSHLSFGSGPHVCIGMALARMEARIALKNYLNSSKELSLARDTPITFYPSFHFRALEKLTIKCSN